MPFYQASLFLMEKFYLFISKIIFLYTLENVIINFMYGYLFDKTICSSCIAAHIHLLFSHFLRISYVALMEILQNPYSMQ